jgi:V/A-type H+-transporting ATPase subunit F
MSKDITNKIAIIGPADIVSGFKALGVESFEAHTPDEAMSQLRKLKQIALDEQSTTVYAVVCIIEDLMVGIDEKEYSRVVEGPLPAVVILPGPQGSQGFAEARLRKLSEKAIGAAII